MAATKKLIFIVDDEEMLRTALEGYLKNKGYFVIAIDDGPEVLVQCERFLPDLIISDIRMPRLDGISLMEGLRNREKTKEIPVIFMSAYVDDEVFLKARKLGAEDFLIKPFELKKLDQLIEKVFL